MTRERRLKNPEKAKAEYQAYRERHLEAIRASARRRAVAHRAADPEAARIRERAWAKASAERIRQQKRARYAANPEKKRAERKAWRLTHLDAEKAAGHAWYRNNKEKAQALSRKWRQANPEENRAKANRYRVRRLNAPGSHSIDEWLALVADSNHCCIYCGNSGRLTRDHAIPLTRGGSDDIANIRPACVRCNVRKGTKTEEEFRQSLKVAA